MKTSVVYFSLSGNSEYVAQEIHKEIGADLVKLETVKPYPTNVAALFLVGGRSALVGEKPELKPYQFNDKESEAVIFITPNWANVYVPAIRSFLAKHALKNKKVGVIICSKGGKAEKCIQKFEEALPQCEMVGTLGLIDPGKNKTDEDLAKIKALCKAFK